MSRQPFAHVADTQLAFRKGLFVALAALLTLVLCQQFHYWTQAPEPLVHLTHTTTAPRLSELTAQGAAVQGRLQAVESVDPIEPAHREPRWVF